MIHLVQSSLPTGSHTTLLSSAFLVAQLPLSSFVAEYFDLRITSVRRLLTNIRSGIFERVNLYVQGKTFHSFLCAEMEMSEFTSTSTALVSPEISGKTLNGKINFSGRLQGVPVHSQGVVRELLNVSH